MRERGWAGPDGEGETLRQPPRPQDPGEGGDEGTPERGLLPLGVGGREAGNRERGARIVRCRQGAGEGTGKADGVLGLCGGCLED